MADTITRTELFRIPPSPAVALWAKLVKAAAELHPTMAMSDQETIDGWFVVYAPPRAPETIELPWDADTHSALLTAAADVLDEVVDEFEDAEWGYIDRDMDHPTLDGDLATHLYVALGRADEVARRWPNRAEDQPKVNGHTLGSYAHKLLPLLRGDTTQSDD